MQSFENLSGIRQPYGLEPVLHLVMAMTSNRLVAVNDRLPWGSIQAMPSDLRDFRQEVEGNCVLMGRATWDTLKRPLRGCLNIVLSSKPAPAELPPNVVFACSLKHAFDLARSTDHWMEKARREFGFERIVVIGGPTLLHTILASEYACNLGSWALTVTDPMYEFPSFSGVELNPRKLDYAALAALGIHLPTLLESHPRVLRHESDLVPSVRVTSVDYLNSEIDAAQRKVQRAFTNAHLWLLCLCATVAASAVAWAIVTFTSGEVTLSMALSGALHAVILMQIVMATVHAMPSNQRALVEATVKLAVKVRMPALLRSPYPRPLAKPRFNPDTGDRT